MARFEFTGGLEDFTSEEASTDAGDREDTGSNAPENDAIASQSSRAWAPPRSLEELAEARAAEYERFQEVSLEDFANEEGSADARNRDEAGANTLAIEAFPSEPSPAETPSRSPEEVAKARDVHDDRLQLVDSLEHPTADVGATESDLSTVATRPPLYRYRSLTVAAATLLVLAAVTATLVVVRANLLRRADGSVVYSSTPPQPATGAPAVASVNPPAAASSTPASSGDADRTASSVAVTSPLDERATTGAGRLSSDKPVDTTASRRENAPARDTQLLKAPPVDERSPATRTVARAEDAPANPVPALALRPTAPPPDAAPMPAPRPSIATPAERSPAASLPIAAGSPSPANTAARTAVPSDPPPSTGTVRTPPTTSASEAAAPEISRPALTERGDTAAAAAVEGINATLRRLQLAYEQRDARLAKAVWPTVNERALARAFESLRSQSVTFDRCRMNVLSGTAEVECRGVMNYVPRVGSKDPRTESRQWTFRVRKGDDQWLITNAEAR